MKLNFYKPAIILLVLQSQEGSREKSLVPTSIFFPIAQYPDCGAAAPVPAPGGAAEPSPPAAVPAGVGAPALPGSRFAPR